MNSVSKYSFGKVTWKCPSNIALIKYWGKRGHQLPLNPSLSITLKNAYTVTELAWEKGEGLDFYFDGALNEAFKEKIKKYLDSLPYSFLKEYKFKISSKNTFPHSAGIASSASSMGALGLCLASLIKNEMDEDFYKLASNLARLGSGSACRSVYGNMASWSDEFAIPIKNIHENFKGMKNSILIVDRGVKEVSSRAGHALMENHPYRERRIQRANENYKNLNEAIASGDFETFGAIVEQEALELHALMMTSSPSFILMKPKTLSLIENIKTFRQESGLNLYFTLDAGPNIHLLYPDSQKDKISSFIKEQEVEVLEDEMGCGPELISFEGETYGN
ncbi:MAG: diphosphomevalonate decarboxylase [Epsilonproteobacteria bacterium]|nr:MAG: diphosphomevalonate decarboxylase [Campylobacterota bacterium]RLA65830.1 MAG: diphosphomevalonate decarboxylase [Campylobacterota bacterium]